MPNHKNINDYAIIMGISVYPRFHSIKYANHDAAKFLDWVKSGSGGNLPPNQPPPQPQFNNIQMVSATDPRIFSITTFTDIKNVTPKFEDIENAFECIGLRNADFFGRRLYVYFSGHGFSPYYDEVVLALSDAETGKKTDCLSIHQTRDFFFNKPIFEEVFYILDCCRDENINEDLFYLKSPGLATSYNHEHSSTRQATIMATTYRDEAFEDHHCEDGDNGGILTKALLEHLDGKGYYPGGNITTSTLRDYLLTRVNELAAAIGREQEAEVVVHPPNQEIFIKRIPEENIPTLQLNIYPNKQITGNFYLYSGDFQIPFNQTDASALSEQTPWSVTLQTNTRYTIFSGQTGRKDVIEPHTFNGPGPHYFIFKIEN